MPHFIDEEIEVEIARKPGPPTSFIWRGVEYRIVLVREMRRALDFGKKWWQRRHRDFYVVETEQGQVFELYFNRGVGRKYWVLYRELDD